MQNSVTCDNVSCIRMVNCCVNKYYCFLLLKFTKLFWFVISSMYSIPPKTELSWTYNYLCNITTRSLGFSNFHWLTCPNMSKITQTFTTCTYTYK